MSIPFPTLISQSLINCLFNVIVSGCGGLGLASSQTPTQMHTHYPSSTGVGEKIEGEILWVGRTTGRSLTDYCLRHTRLNLGKINLLPIKIYLDGEKQRQNLKRSSRCHRFGISKYNDGHMNFLVRIVLASSKPTAKLFCAKTVFHNRSPSSVLPTRREHDALGLPGGPTL